MPNERGNINIYGKTLSPSGGTREARINLDKTLACHLIIILHILNASDLSVLKLF